MREWIQDVIDLSAPLIACGAMWLAWRTHESTRRQGQVNNIPRLLLDGYVDVALYSPIDAGNGVVLRTTRDARNWARWMSSSPEGYEKFLAASVEPAKDAAGLRTPENRIAWELSARLQTLGVSAFVGAVPLDAVLADNANTLVDDWTFCHRLVFLNRGPPAPSARLRNGLPLVEFHRRHAEWLACVAALWLEHKSVSNELDRMYETFAGPGELHRAEARRRMQARIRAIEQSDYEILSDLTRQQLKRLRSRKRRFPWRRGHAVASIPGRAMNATRGEMNVTRGESGD